ncbi:MAG: hypothetical protein ACM3ZT_10365 [Bacillota bacterium]
MIAFLDPDWIRSIEPGHFWLFTCGVCAVSLAAFFATWHFYRRLQLVEDTPRSLIRSAAQGYVELSGRSRLMPGDPILAPLSRTRCVWWSYSIEVYVRSGRSSHWKTLDSGISGELFLVVDETGQCVVDPEGASVYSTAKDVWYGNSDWPEGGPAMGGSRFGANYRYTEQRMHENDPVYALGYFHTQDPASEANIDDEVRQQLVVWKKDQAWLLQHFDTNHDGQVDPQEWEGARQEARRLVLERERENMSRPPVNVLSRSPDSRDFILSALPQGSLESRLRLYALACMALFFAAGALGTYLLSVRLS